MAITSQSLIQGVGEGLKDWWCTGLNATEPFTEPAYNLLRVAGYSKGPLTAAGVELAIVGIDQARKYAKQFACGDDPATLPPLDFSPGFTGGQCPQDYRVFYSYDNFNQAGENIGTTNTQSLRRGPIGGVSGPTLSPAGPGNTQYTWTIQTGLGPQTLTSTVGPTGGVVPRQNLAIDSVELLSGLPDNCGDPPPLFPEGSDSEGGTIDIVGEDENGDPVTLPDEPFIIFNPTLDINGDIIVDVELPGLDVCGQFKLGPNGGFTPQSCGPKNQPERPITQAPEGDGTTTPDEDFDEDEELEEEVAPGETILGVIIKSQAIQPRISQTQAPNGAGPVILVPRIAAVSFRAEVDAQEGKLTGWTDPQDLRSVDAYYPAPQGVRVTNSSVTWQPNWRGTKQNVVGPWPPEPPPPPTVTLA